ncbi:VPLPA-CTERM sorting domain-containing protein [Tateyamaria sp. syn59]|uniref:VPLPA-CTERM sorting domain-containing protein n=1 Tax=Tateyamaria sp. syn59 TaxID=2576942 RepID=UPI0011BFBD6C|nr:VPLPA-CTERM sorting domain-containing protein [Tateyamaria sp. syn59]
MTFKTTFHSAYLAAALTAAASVASATTINFDSYENYTRGSNYYTSTDGQVSVGVDGVHVSSDGTIVNSRNFWTASWEGPNNSGGLGVYDCRLANLCIDNTKIDGSGPDEFALMDFGNLIVEITSVTFSYWDSTDTFAFGVYEDTSLPAQALIYEEDLGEGDENPYTFNFAPGTIVGSIIGFGADSWRDSFRLNSITFDIVGAVPLPAGGLLLLTGLGGLAVMRRRKKAGAPVAA